MKRGSSVLCVVVLLTLLAVRKAMRGVSMSPLSPMEPMGQSTRPLVKPDKPERTFDIDTSVPGVLTRVPRRRPKPPKPPRFFKFALAGREYISSKIPWILIQRLENFFQNGLDLEKARGLFASQVAVFHDGARAGSSKVPHMGVACHLVAQVYFHLLSGTAVSAQFNLGQEIKSVPAGTTFDLASSIPDESVTIVYIDNEEEDTGCGRGHTFLVVRAACEAAVLSGYSTYGVAVSIQDYIDERLHWDLDLSQEWKDVAELLTNLHKEHIFEQLFQCNPGRDFPVERFAIEHQPLQFGFPYFKKVLDASGIPEVS